MRRSLLSPVRSHPRLAGLSRPERRKAIRQLRDAHGLAFETAAQVVIWLLAFAALPFFVLVWGSGILDGLESTRTPDIVFFPVFLATLAPGLAVMWLGTLLFLRIFDNRMLDRAPKAVCPRCGYDLGGLQGRPCPECGRGEP